MRKSFTALLILMVDVMGWQSYQLITAREMPTPHRHGSLSDVADEVLAMPLHGTKGYGIDSAHNIRQDGNNVFLISKGIVYRFNRHGDLVCRISDPAQIHAAGYVLDPAHERIVVMGNVDDVFYYSYEGKLIVQKKLKSNIGKIKIHSMAMYGNHLYATVRRIDSERGSIEENVIEYDTELNEIGSYRLSNIPNDERVFGYIDPQLAITPDTDELYAWSYAANPIRLAEDTLMLKNAMGNGTLDTLAGNDIPLLSVRLGSRIWLSSKDRQEDSYIFCYDSRDNECWQVKSLNDDFFHTGEVTSLEPADDNGECYTFVRHSGQQTVVYIVSMMS